MSSDKKSDNSNKDFSKSFESDSDEKILSESDLDKYYKDKLEEFNESDEKYHCDENIDKEDDHEIFIAEKLSSFSKNDMKRKYPIIAILGVVLGLILVIIAVILFSKTSEKIVDNVSFEESGIFDVLIGLVGFIILGLSFIRLFAKNYFSASIFKSLDNIDSSKPNEEKLNSKSKKNTKSKKNKTEKNEDRNNDKIV
ncbi:MAG: DUF973 family protein [Methanobrevibacter sp.]|jgi:hypothetical protein|nr:DUF973 family protein [Candidatus Methanovirga meridionalis]